MAPKIDLSILRQFLHEHLGLYFTVRQDKDLYRKISEAAHAFGYQDVDGFIAWLVQQQLNNDQTEKLAEFLTIGETYFLREKKAYDYLEFDYLPRLIAERRAAHNKTLKIWSAGCASGEEPYTLAILLQQLLPDIDKWDITLLATDINPTFLQKARLGVYSKWSFRKAPSHFIQNNFEEIAAGRFQVVASVRRMVTFAYLNLVDDVFPSFETKTNNMDVIFCRNVMIYFSPEGIVNIGNKFFNCVSQAGILITSPVEVSSMQRSKFKLSVEHGCHVFSKGSTNIQKQENRVNKEERQEAFSSQLVLDKLAQIPRPLKIKEKQVELQPVSTKADVPHYTKALQCYQEGKLPEAEKMLKAIMEKQSEMDEAVVLLLARIYGNVGQLEPAMALCKQVIANNSIEPSAHYLLAVVYAELGRIDEAIRSAENALFLEYDYLLAHYLLGSIRLQDADQRYSKKHFENLERLLKQREDTDLVDEIDQLTVKELKHMLSARYF